MSRARSSASQRLIAAARVCAAPATSGLRPVSVIESGVANGTSGTGSRSTPTSAQPSIAPRSRRTSQSQNIGRHGWPHIVTPSGWAHTPVDIDIRSRPSVARCRVAAEVIGAPVNLLSRALSAA